MKIQSLVLIGIVALGLTGCGSDSEEMTFEVIQEATTQQIPEQEGSGDDQQKKEARVPGELPEGVTEEMLANKGQGKPEGMGDELEVDKQSRLPGELPEGVNKEMSEKRAQGRTEETKNTQIEGNEISSED